MQRAAEVEKIWRMEDGRWQEASDRKALSCCDRTVPIVPSWMEIERLTDRPASPTLFLPADSHFEFRNKDGHH